MHIHSNTSTVINAVEVNTSARLHMGFFDLSGSNNSKFGSLGLAIDAPSTQITITKSEKTLIDTKSNENVANIVENIVKMFNIKQYFSLTINQSIPVHAGLGSGTQMALAIGMGINHLFDLQLSASQVAIATMRGKRSGIGIGAFEQGGFLMDTGKVDATKLAEALPKIAMRQDFPEDWRVLLVQDSAHIGVHGTLESQAFKTLKPVTGSLRSMMFEHMIPAMQRADLLAFGACMQDLQAYNGAYFAPIQGGHYASQDAGNVLDWLQKNGVACVGQSSWGPTCFAILQNQQQAEALQYQAERAFSGKPNISFQIVRGKNFGATIDIFEDSILQTSI